MPTFNSFCNKKKFHVLYFNLPYINLLVGIIVPCLNRCELRQNLKFYLLQKEILICRFLLFL